MTDKALPPTMAEVEHMIEHASDTHRKRYHKPEDYRPPLGQVDMRERAAQPVEFHVGDRVRVVNMRKSYAIHPTRFVGKTGTIWGIGSGSCSIGVDFANDGFCSFFPDELECVSSLSSAPHADANAEMLHERAVDRTEVHRLKAALMTAIDNHAAAEKRIAALLRAGAPAPVADSALREKLAALAHEQWSGWIRYQFDKMIPPERQSGAFIPAELWHRWARQMNTAYADLPDNEKESDRKEADRVLALLPKTAPHPDAEREKYAKWCDERRRSYVPEEASFVTYGRIAALLREGKAVPVPDARLQELAKWCDEHAREVAWEEHNANLREIAAALRAGKSEVVPELLMTEDRRFTIGVGKYRFEVESLGGNLTVQRKETP